MDLATTLTAVQTMLPDVIMVSMVMAIIYKVKAA